MDSILLILALASTPIETTPFNNPLIATYEATQIQETVEPELTVQQKIDSNFYECDTDIQYIWASDATCHDKPVYVPPKAISTVRTTQSGSNAPSGWYPYGQCTYWVYTQRSVGNWNNASEWVWQAQRDGYATGSTPRVGAIAQRGNHVAYVTSIGKGSVTITEMNWQGLGVVSTRTVPASYFTYIY
jgi:surface antigen